MNNIKCICDVPGAIIPVQDIWKKTCSKCGRKLDRKRKSKYHNKKTIVDNITFHSKKEANRYIELKLLKKGGYIDYLELQPKYDIVVNGIKIGFYKADFRYWDIMGDLEKVEDTKGYRTQIYKLKKKLVEAIYNIKILET